MGLPQEPGGSNVVGYFSNRYSAGRAGREPVVRKCRPDAKTREVLEK